MSQIKLISTILISCNSYMSVRYLTSAEHLSSFAHVKCLTFWSTLKGCEFASG